MSMNRAQWAELLSNCFGVEVLSEDGHYRGFHVHLPPVLLRVAEWYKDDIDTTATVFSNADWQTLFETCLLELEDMDKEYIERMGNRLVSCDRCEEEFPRKTMTPVKKYGANTMRLFCSDCLIIMQSSPRPCVYCGIEFIASTNNNIETLCLSCRFLGETSEMRRLNQALNRARKVNEPATLTFDKWKKIVFDFEGLCAYCREQSFEVIEHFVPIGKGKGTTAQNCVPACSRCNKEKIHKHISVVDMARVQSYLESN